MTKDEMIAAMTTDRAQEYTALLLREIGMNDLSGEEVAGVISSLYGVIARAMLHKHGSTADKALTAVALQGASAAGDFIDMLRNEAKGLN